jgi:hypothetical protein
VTTPDGRSAPPSTAALDRLGADAWAQLLPHVRAVLRGLDERDVTPAIERLRAAPTSRLVGGRLRRDLTRLVARDGPVWAALAERLAARDDLPSALTWLVGAGEPPTDVAPRRAPAEPPAAPAGDAAELAELRERLRAARRDRDDARRRAEGETARADALAREVATLRDVLAAVEAARDTAAAALAAADAERARAVERERRRHAARNDELAAELAALRRAEDRRRTEERRDEEARRARAEAARRVERRAEDTTSDAGRLVPGRPSRLPPDVAPGTTAAARLLLHPGRRVLVDGYNVTKQHRPQLDLEEQRTWLVGQLAALVARRRVRPTVVFDGERAGGGRPPGGARGVVVRFTAAGIPADDELVLDVEATDEPVTVVTDDRELAGRLRTAGADVIGTRPFLGVLG